MPTIIDISLSNKFDFKLNLVAFDVQSYDESHATILLSGLDGNRIKTAPAKFVSIFDSLVSKFGRKLNHFEKSIINDLLEHAKNDLEKHFWVPKKYKYDVDTKTINDFNLRWRTYALQSFFHHFKLKDKMSYDEAVQIFREEFLIRKVLNV